MKLHFGLLDLNEQMIEKHGSLDLNHDHPDLREKKPLIATECVNLDDALLEWEVQISPIYLMKLLCFLKGCEADPSAQGGDFFE